MSTPDWTLARRAVACPHWRWMDGMRVESLAWKWDGPTLPYRFREDFHAQPNPTAWPDLTDPATMGCLLALVREAWGSPHAYVGHSNEWETAFSCKVGAWEFEGTTEAAALVAALEAAP